MTAPQNEVADATGRTFHVTGVILLMRDDVSGHEYQALLEHVVAVSASRSVGKNLAELSLVFAGTRLQPVPVVGTWDVANPPERHGPHPDDQSGLFLAHIEVEEEGA